ncbi:MAG: hypothetical protein DWQ31_05030 [Planctomycetota bacterium]|nr:MAG: hypothetical protein DWQ31_05030 [Planctomycetota bacterium]REJ96307.1 MAG: hypothetical protein DWQ35_04800 [Planctomycetota bacterium]REK30608.1 MAG: hypothetical protein DWQ42_01585 [Planctomycetota bacterium]REK44241.1 MAG: hypothetical protein DWQ46_10450 [Planctomycetota bacterium]
MRRQTGTGHGIRNLLAIRFAGARGDVSRSNRVLWVRRRGTPYVPSPLLYDETLYCIAEE